MSKNILCLAVSDLHGNIALYKRLCELIVEKKPSGVFIAGDITGGYYRTRLGEDLNLFITVTLGGMLRGLKKVLNADYPEIFVILGNDDPAFLEEACEANDEEGLWHYMHKRCQSWKEYKVCGYACVPPTPFQMKDWEKYDVSRYVDVGATPPMAGFRTVEADALEMEWGTIQRDLQQLYGTEDLSSYICLFHAPPYKSNLDRAALDGKMVDHAPLDVHIGSIAISRFISSRQPLISIHGHVHESTSLTGKYYDKLKNTMMFNPANDEKRLSVVYFDPQDPGNHRIEYY